jgi:hypothetical protein
MRFLCLYKSSKPEGVPPTQEEMIEMGKLIEEQMKSGVLLATEDVCQAHWARASGSLEESSP